MSEGEEATDRRQKTELNHKKQQQKESYSLIRASAHTHKHTHLFFPIHHEAVTFTHFS